MDRLAKDAGRTAACYTALLDQIRTVLGDDVRYLDVGVVDRGAETRQEAGREHQSHVLGLADFGLQRVVATQLAIVLTRGRRQQGAPRRVVVNGGRQTRERALRRAVRTTRSAKIRASIERHIRRLE